MATIAVSLTRTPLTWLEDRLRAGLLTPLLTLLLLTVGAWILYPILLLLISSFREGRFGAAEVTWGLANWQAAFSEPRMVAALQNTVTLSATRQAIAMVAGVAIAWLLARTNMPWRNWLEVGFWIALFLPSLPILLGWILLLDGYYGLINVWWMSLPFTTGPLIEIFSWWGIIFANLVTGTFPVKVFLLTPAFRNMDAALEEASRTAGANTISTLVRIVLPLLLPTILVVLLLGFIRSMQSFEVELVLGTPAQIDVYSTLIYRQVQREPPNFAHATALAMIVLAALVPLIALQQWIGMRRSRTTVSGKSSTRLHDLGRLKWPLFIAIVGLLFFIIVVPVVFMFVGTFMRVFGMFNLPSTWTLNNWQLILRDPLLLRAFWNTVYIAVGSTVVSLVMFTVIAYVIVRTRFWGRRILDFMTWLPATVPGIVAGLGILVMVLQTPFLRPLYGSIWILIIALGFASMTVSVQLLKGSLLQLGSEMEEASWAVGAGWLYTLRRIIIPLIAPTIAVVALTNFSGAVSVVSLIALLGSGTNIPLSILQLQYIDSGRFEAASVIGVFIFIITVAAAIVARIYGLRAGVGRFSQGR